MPTLAERRRREAQEAALQGKIGADPLRNSFSHANGSSNSTAPPPSRDARDAASRRLSSAQPAAYAAVGAAASGAPPSPPPSIEAAVRKSMPARRGSRRFRLRGMASLWRGGAVASRRAATRRAG